MTDPVLDFTAGSRARDRGVARVETNSARWVQAIRRHAELIARTDGTVTADDLRTLDGNLRYSGIAPSHPNAWGSIFRTKEWEACGYVNSRCPSNHARRITVWRLK